MYFSKSADLWRLLKASARTSDSPGACSTVIVSWRVAAMSQSSLAQDAITGSLAFPFVREWAAAMLSVLMTTWVHWRLSGIRDFSAIITFRASRRDM